eukprot:4386839-Amphidinium_carterae.4
MFLSRSVGRQSWSSWALEKGTVMVYTLTAQKAVDKETKMLIRHLHEAPYLVAAGTDPIEASDLAALATALAKRPFVIFAGKCRQLAGRVVRQAEQDCKVAPLPEDVLSMVMIRKVPESESENWTKI